MTLRLRYQISIFLFVLFAVVIFVMGFFNLTILNDQLKKLSLSRAKSAADRIMRIIDKNIPPDVDSLEEHIKENESFDEFQKFALGVEAIRNAELYDKTGRLVYSGIVYEDVHINNSAIVKEALYTGEPITKTWVVDPVSGNASEVESFNPMDGRIMLEDYYIPILNGKNEIIGLAHLSIHLEQTTRLMKFIIFANVSLLVFFYIIAFIAIYMWSERAISRPFQFLLRAQEQLSRGDFDAHIEIELPQDNEMGIIANSFNRMAVELKAYKEELEEKSKKLEQVNLQYKELNETLEQEVEKKTLELREFFSLITHDLKIPLAAIKGYIALLKKNKTGELNEKQEKFISAIETSTLSLLSMVRNMLDSVKYDAGKVTYLMEEFDIKDLIAETHSNLHPIIDERSINLIIDVPKNCNKVYGDKTKIAQVFANIFYNAVEHVSEGGTIELQARENETHIEIMIKDDGPGIPPEQLQCIFDKFKQVPGKESPSTSLGLGLYIVKKIIEGHGGRAWAESIEGKGSRFFFTLNKSTESLDANE